MRLYLPINSNIHAIIEQIIFVAYVEPLTVSPCQNGNPPVPGNSPAKVTLIIYWQSAKGEREPVRLFFSFFLREWGVCARESVRGVACVCLLEEPLNGGGGALRTSALLIGNNLQ